jgi:hypothetical protein
VELLGAVDEAPETLSGPATQKILCESPVYRKRRIAYRKTRPVQVAIGERRRPNPEGKPGYLRIGDLEGMKGVYHVNAVDDVTARFGASPRILGGCTPATPFERTSKPFSEKKNKGGLAAELGSRLQAQSSIRECES